ncbi:hypothetical protein PQ472_07945 [Lacticaseibacillus pabuli]|uniref:Uncharacterized protein n=1 Tax=Lacticaseibacillus pabuli TaxID=3025672 RepID=A0ABY7WNS5_9LACO|nr:hypothetical protein [Lacticaseibacillus sp. KACC 23028]WDF81857.1 hypothetical protein PQ472_07945 [Lacticaseibacillus sp. KACC 23028]
MSNETNAGEFTQAQIKDIRQLDEMTSYWDTLNRRIVAAMAEAEHDRD